MCVGRRGEYIRVGLDSLSMPHTLPPHTRTLSHTLITFFAQSEFTINSNWIVNEFLSRV
jgi:hypothetical protein